MLYCHCWLLPCLLAQTLQNLAKKRKMLAQDVPAIEAENSEDAKNKDISAEEAQAKDENKDELKKEHKCDDADKECDEEKMTEDEKDKSIKIEDSSKED